MQHIGLSLGGPKRHDIYMVQNSRSGDSAAEWAMLRLRTNRLVAGKGARDGSRLRHAWTPPAVACVKSKVDV